MKRIALAGNPNSGKPLCLTLSPELRRTWATGPASPWTRGRAFTKMRRSVADCGLARNILFVSVHAGGGDFPKLHSGRKARLHNKHRRRDKSGKEPLSDHSAYGNRRADCGGAQHDGRREENGDSVDGATLEKKIGLPVVEISALRGEGISRLMERLMLRARANAAE